MPSIAARVATGGMIALALGVVVAGQAMVPSLDRLDRLDRLAAAAPLPPAKPLSPQTCPGWIASGLPAMRWIDIERISDDDVWLLGERALYHWDGCAWRVHAPFRDLVGLVIEWSDIAVDPAGALWLQGRHAEGPMVGSGCVIGPAYPARDGAYELVGREWLAVGSTGAPPKTREVLADPRMFGADREVLVTSGTDDDRWAIVRATRLQNGMMFTDHEVWRQRDDGPWVAVARPPREAEPAADFGGMFGDWWIDGRGGSHGNLWSVGYLYPSMAAEVRRFDGQRWTSFAGRLPADANRLSAVWSASASDTWVVGAMGLVMHWDGVTWSKLPPPIFADLRRVRVEDGWLVVGGAGVTFRYALP